MFHAWSRVQNKKTKHPTKTKKKRTGSFSSFTTEEREPEASQPGLLDTLFPPRADWKTYLGNVMEVFVCILKMLGLSEIDLEC